jgi:ATP-dependent Clp protease ATP-binding subunit ClpA
VFERFNENAIKSIMLAQEEARRLQRNRVGTEQILLGLLGVGTSKTALILSTFSASSNLHRDARAQVDRTIGKGNDKVAIEIPFTQDAKLLLEGTWLQATKYGHNYIGEEHLFLSLLEQSDTVALKVLTNLGFSIEKLKQEAVQMLPSPVFKFDTPSQTTEESPDTQRARIKKQSQAWQNRADMATQQGNEELRLIALNWKAQYDQELDLLDKDSVEQ